MTDPVSDPLVDRLAYPVDDGEHRQHTSADVAPELFEDVAEPP